MRKTVINMTKISVILTTKNEEKNIGDLLKILVEQEDPYEVIIVDSESTDRTREIVEEYSKKYVIFSGPSFENWDVDDPFEKELSKLLFGINVNRFNFELDRMKHNGAIKNYYYKDRPNKKDIIERKILVVEVDNGK